MFRIIKDASMQDTPVLIDNEIFTEPEEECCEEEPELVEEPVIEEEPVAVIDWEEIQRQADEVLADAKTRAEQELNAARAQVEEIKKTAHGEGYKKGFDEGKQEGLTTGKNEGMTLGREEGIQQGRQQALEEMQENLAAAAEKSQYMLEMAREQVYEMLATAEPHIVEIAVAVASKVVAREIEENPMMILPIVRKAVEKVKDQETVSIRVNPQDFDMVLMAKKELQVMIGREQALTLAADNTISPGGCVIDTSNGTVDARLDTQFEMIRKALTEVLP
ncbi:MAG TPA: FliH/SctL family protein [Patescibacteria group bacterium]|nr:FliH/SctL family protein [Patescibacteria group bacterium]